MSSSADDIRILLEAESSLGLALGTDLFVGVMPDAPDACVSVLDTPGYSADPNNYQHAGLQILVRAALGGYLSAYSLAENIWDTIHEYYGQPASGSYYYTLIWGEGQPFFIGVDEQSRPMFSMNFRLQRR